MAPKVQERNPYVGPRPFEWQDRDLFFGRDREASEVLSLVIAHRALLLYAQSGSGKTSLLNARLIPLLEEEGFEVLPLARVRGLPEDIEPEEIPNLYVFNTLMSWAAEEADPRRLAQMSFADFLKEREHPTDEMGLPSPRVVILDQFEELFSFYQERWPDREGFFEQVRDALEEDDLLRVVFVIREDYIAQLDPFAPLLPEKLRTRFRMERLGKEAALAAVKGPLRDTRRSFAEGVAEQLVEELLKVRVQTASGETAQVPGEFVEPVQLQVVCQSLWQDLPPDVTVITGDHLQTFGDVDQALSGFYGRSIKRAVQDTDATERELRAWFESRLITPAGTRGTVYRGREETGGIPNTAVDVLENLHLIRGEWRAGARWYELTHDRFIGPIQTSNEAWRAMRRGIWLRIGGAVAVVVTLLLVGIAAWLKTEATQADQQWQATLTAAAVELSEFRATATVEAIANDYVHQGFGYAELGDYEQAIAAYTKAIELDPDCATAYHNRGIAYRKLGDYDQAIADHSKAIELDAENAKYYNNRGFAYNELEEYTLAISDFTKAIELDPGYAFAYNNRGWAYSQLEDYTRAFQDFEKSIELNRDNPWVYYYRGLTYADQGDTENAITDLEMALQLSEPPLDEKALNVARTTLDRLQGQ